MLSQLVFGLTVTCEDGRVIGRTPFNAYITDAQLCGEAPIVLPVDILPDGFEFIFGPRPRSEDFRNAPNPSVAFRVATVLWKQDLKYFKQVGPPEWATAEQIGLATGVAEFWGMGAPAFYEGRYGFMARFPESQLFRFEATAWAVINFMHHEVAAYQIRLLNNGVQPETRHPFVPPQLFE